MARTPRPRHLVVAAALLVAVAAAVGIHLLGGGGATRARANSPASGAPYDVTPLLRPHGRMLGVVGAGTPWQYGLVRTFTRQAGRAPDIREYYTSWGDDFDAEGNAFLWQHGQLPMLALVPTPQVPLAAIASGAQDGYIRRLAGQIAAYRGPLALSFAGEMNGPWNSWGPPHATAAQFVAAWRHLHDVFAARGVTNVIWVWSPHVSDSGTTAALHPYYPGDRYTDWVGLIGYYGPIDGTAFRSLFTPTLRQVAAFTGHPVLITETGVAQSPRKEAQIADLFRGAVRSGLIGLVWYDQSKTWPGSSQPTDWRIDTSVGAEAAFRVESARAGFGHRFGS